MTRRLRAACTPGACAAGPLRVGIPRGSENRGQFRTLSGHTRRFRPPHDPSAKRRKPRAGRGLRERPRRDSNPRITDLQSSLDARFQAGIGVFLSVGAELARHICAVYAPDIRRPGHNAGHSPSTRRSIAVSGQRSIGVAARAVRHAAAAAKIALMIIGPRSISAPFAPQRQHLAIPADWCTGPAILSRRPALRKLLRSRLSTTEVPAKRAGERRRATTSPRMCRLATMAPGDRSDGVFGGDGDRPSGRQAPEGHRTA
jgi:hypothetical protein